MSAYDIEKKLLLKADGEYKKFHSALIPGIDNILGVRVPEIRKIAKAYANTEGGFEFLSELPHRYYDENMLHGIIIGYTKAEYGVLEKYVHDFLPYVDNWAVCDSFVSSLKYFFKDKEKCLDLVRRLIGSDSVYKIRFALVSLLNYYVDNEHIDEALSLTLSVTRDDYYVKMAQAWLVSVCLVKEYEKTVKVLESRLFSPWVHNKAIQKARESLRISKERKAYLNSLKVKE